MRLIFNHHRSHLFASLSLLLLPLISGQSNTSTINDAIQFTFDASCGTDHRDLISKAFNDSMQMAKLVHEDSIQPNDNPALWELFGPYAVARIPMVSAINSVFEEIANGTWTISASCSLDGKDVKCTDRFMYGGIGEEVQHANFSPKLVFCPEFFSFPPLDYRVNMGINNAEAPMARYDIGQFHDNQATTLLRTMFHYLPQLEDIGRPISDLWVLMRHPGSVKWTACYGVFCAKILARLADEKAWSMMNADNWALYALSVYVRMVLDQKEFPWFPRLDRNYDGSFEIVQPLNTSEGNGTFTATEWFSKPGLISQLKYDTARYQYGNDVTGFTSDLDPNRMADISNARWRPSELDFPASYVEGSKTFLEKWSSAYGNQSSYIGIPEQRICFRDDRTAKFPSAQVYDINRVTNTTSRFCNESIRDLLPTKPVVTPSIYRNASNMYANVTFWRAEWTTQITFLISGDPASYLRKLPLNLFFEGNGTEAQIASCSRIFTDIVSTCDHGEQEDYGGLVKYNDRVFAVFSTLRSESTMPIDLSPAGSYQCHNYNATSYWRAAATVQNLAMNDGWLDRLCSCYYEGQPFVAGLFCKPAEGCEALAKSGQVEARDNLLACA